MIVVACTTLITLEALAELLQRCAGPTITTENTREEFLRRCDDALSPAPGIFTLIEQLLATLEQDDAMKRNNLTTSVVAGLAAIKGIASTCNAVELNPDGLGHRWLKPWHATSIPRHARRTKPDSRENYTHLAAPRRRFQRHR